MTENARTPNFDCAISWSKTHPQHQRSRTLPLPPRKQMLIETEQPRAGCTRADKIPYHQCVLERLNRRVPCSVDLGVGGDTPVELCPSGSGTLPCCPVQHGSDSDQPGPLRGAAEAPNSRVVEGALVPRPLWVRPSCSFTSRHVHLARCLC